MIRVFTTFDIVPTGNAITDSYCRKNWNTLQQIINLRCQIDIVNQPYVADDVNCFDFNPQVPSVYANISDPLFYLKQDSTGVPMLRADTDDQHQFQVEKLDALGQNKNIWFEIINR